MTPTDLQYNRQTYRYDRTLQNFAQIIKDNNDIIIVGDDNIDTLKDNNKYNNYNNFELKDLRQQFLTPHSRRNNQRRNRVSLFRQILILIQNIHRKLDFIHKNGIQDTRPPKKFS